jgi:DNA-binding MarR family transcriptional regulator
MTLQDNYSNSIGFYIQEVAKKSTEKFNQEFRQIGITYSQFRVLNCLWKKGDLTQKEIHKIIAVRPSTLTGILEILEKKELVTKKMSQEDERFRMISLTDKGRLLEKDAWETILYFDKLVEELYDESFNSQMLEELKRLSNRLDLWR